MLNLENRSSIPSGFINTTSSSIAGDTSSTNSSSHSNFLLTPEDGSSWSREGNAHSSHREQHLSELGRLQTNFHSDRHNESLAESQKIEHRAYGSEMSDNSEDCTPKEAEACSYTDEPTLKSYTLEEERRVVKKFDLRLTMFMALLYMLSFVDRSSEFSSWSFKHHIF